MHTVLLAVFISLFTASIDVSNPKRLPDMQKTQHDLMHHALGGDIIYTTPGEAESNADVCMWETIHCTDGIVTAIWASDIHILPGAQHSVLTEWLPPTLEFIHFHSICVPNLWKTMCLPRELKYLYLNLCNDWGQKPARVDFARLPRKMEEIIVIKSIMGGRIYVDNMPETMRFVFFRVLADFRGVFVNYRSLLGTLETLHFSPIGDFKIRVKEIGKPRAVKLETKYDDSDLHKRSKYAGMFESRLS